MSDTKTKKASCLFEELLDKKESAITAQKKPILINRAKRSFESARDNAISDREDAKLELLNLRKEPENIKENLPKMIEARRKAKAADEMIDHICAEYKELFGTDLPKEV